MGREAVVSTTRSTVEQAFEALYTDDETALDTAASLLAADRTADAELARRGEEFVRRAWERGWQPADLVRLVRRDLAEEHVRLAGALITSETGRYERLPRRWAAQLADLDTTPSVRTASPPRRRPWSCTDSLSGCRPWSRWARCPATRCRPPWRGSRGC